MVKDAESHAEDDRKKQQVIEARNQADNLIYTTEKTLRDVGAGVDAVLKGDIENRVQELKKVMDSDDAETIKRATEALATASHKLAEQLYAQKTQAQGGGAGQQAQPDAGGQESKGRKDDDDVVDADYTEVK